MTVTCLNIDEFIANLENEHKLFQDVVRVSIGRRPVGPENEQKAYRFDVVLQASAVVYVDEDQGQFLLQVGVDCGRDYEDADAERPGTAIAKGLFNRIEQYVKERGWRVLPGIIGE